MTKEQIDQLSDPTLVSEIAEVLATSSHAGERSAGERLLRALEARTPSAKQNTDKRPIREARIMPLANERGGIKLDAGKPLMGLLPGDALRSVAEVMTFGANKYAPDNWKQVEPERYTHALFRHLSLYLDGQVNDEETGLPHMAHIATNALFLLHLAKDRVCR